MPPDAAPAAPPAAPAAAPPATPPAAPWYQGKLDPELIGHAQIKGWKLDDPQATAIEAIKQHREAEKFIGAPADQLLKLPKDTDPKSWEPIWQRLGAPKDAKEYDFSAVKFSNGDAVDQSFADAMRATFSSLHLPKEWAAPITAAVVKYMDDADKAEATLSEAKRGEEIAALMKSWGPNAELNKLTAMQGAKRLGVSPETVAELEKAKGYAGVMEMFRKAGAGLREDTFHEGGQGGNSNPVTSDGAYARIQELNRDETFTKRLMAKEVAALNEYDALHRQWLGITERE